MASGVKYPVGPDAPAFVQDVATAVGLDPRVVAVWSKAEGAYPSPPGTGGWDYLNMRPGREPYSGTSPGGFDLFSDVGEAVGSTAQRLNTLDIYAGIRQQAGQSPAAQIAAISASPWDAGHYVEHGANTLDTLFVQDYGQSALGSPGQKGTPTPPSGQPGPSGGGGGSPPPDAAGCHSSNFTVSGPPAAGGDFTGVPCSWYPVAASGSAVGFYPGTMNKAGTECCVASGTGESPPTPNSPGTTTGNGCLCVNPPLVSGFCILPQPACDFFSAITSESFWIRAGEVILGITLLIVGFIVLAKKFGGASTGTAAAAGARAASPSAPVYNVMGDASFAAA